MTRIVPDMRILLSLFNTVECIEAWTWMAIILLTLKQES